ncbi:MAG: hypothetical protein K1X89_10430 [Myxococcaceae bacterium]|nr:hypothetical protein [Myxococcaceae bacterium]
MRVAFAAGLLLTGCLHPLVGLTERASAGALPVAIAYAPAQAADAQAVARVLPQLEAPLAEWGGLREPVEVLLAADHEALEGAVGRRHFEWLRAWATYRQVLLQAPTTWPPAGASDDDVRELLHHELTHCVLFQRARSPREHPGRGIPLWFREGMATVAAGQGKRFLTLEDLADRYAQPGPDPLLEPQELERDDQAFLYGAAHHAFEMLLNQFGHARLEQLVDRLGEGLTFEAAFTAALGEAPAAFAHRFRRYLVNHAFRAPPRPLEATPVRE